MWGPAGVYGARVGREGLEPQLRVRTLRPLFCRRHAPWWDWGLKGTTSPRKRGAGRAGGVGPEGAGARSGPRAATG